MKSLKISSWQLYATTIPLFISLLLFANYLPLEANSPAQQIDQVWRNVQMASQYGYSVDIRQTSTPKPGPFTIGVQATEQTVYLEGFTNLDEQSTHMTIWSDTSSAFDRLSGVSYKVEDGQGYVRQGDTAWQPVDANALQWAAPAGDFTSFLVAAKNVSWEGEETRLIELDEGTTAVNFDRYTFTIHGPTYAHLIRQQIETELKNNFEWLPNQQLNLPALYNDMQAHGELWVNKQGLPLRQQINIQFPEQTNQQQSAFVEVTFRNWDPPKSANAYRLNKLYTQTKQNLPDITLDISAFIFILLGLAQFLRSRHWQKAGIYFIIVAIVFTPLLQTIYAYDALDRRQQRLGEPTPPPADDTPTTFTPPSSANPTTLNMLRHDPGHDQNNNGFTDYQDLMLNAYNQPATPAQQQEWQLMMTLDTDNDGLTDFEESILGTSPYFADTDGDLVTDTLEIEGFFYNGQQWYTDPLNEDSNGDGHFDGLEWNGIGKESWDTDNDGTPDLFDNDNDGDLVPDHLDHASYTNRSDSLIFDGDTPFELSVDGAQNGRFLFTEFQLRPTNPDHLWYAFNILDWPLDTQGQAQDWDAKTFADVYGNDDLPSTTGDMRLIPMLEITMNRESSQIPFMNQLNLDETLRNQLVSDIYDPTGIAIRVIDDTQVAAYIPLQLMTDPETGERVGFQAEMLYKPNSPWTTAHQVKMVWHVQMLNDTVANCQSGLCTSYNNPTILHAYDDSWQLTSLVLREDSRADVAMIFEDPTLDPNINDDLQLFQLAWNLQQTFLSGRDCHITNVNGECIRDGYRDFTVDSIRQRFDHTINASQTITDRLGIDNHLRVLTANYDNFYDLSLNLGQDQVIPNILDAHFTSQTPITPTVMFATELAYRSISLDSTDNSTLTNTHAHFDMSTLDPTVSAMLSWTPYSYDTTEQTWTTLSTDEYQDVWQARYEDQIATADDPTDAQDKSNLAANMYGLIRQGVQQIVEQNRIILGYRQTASVTDEAIAANTIGVAQPVFSFVAEALTNAIVEYAYDEVDNIIKEGLSSFIKGAFGSVAGSIKIAMMAVGLLIAAAILLVSLINVNDATRTILIQTFTYAAIVVSIIGATFDIIDMVTDYVKVGVQAVSNTINRVLGVIGFIITIGVTWGFFIYAVASGQLIAGTASFKQAVIGAIIATIYAAILLAIAFIPGVGVIITAILGIVDAIFAILCEIGKAESSVSGLKALCGGIAGVLTRYFASSQSLLAVDGINPFTGNSQTDLLIIDDFYTAPLDTEKGFVVNNDFRINLQMRMHFYPIPTDPGQSYYTYLPGYNPDYLSRVNINYNLGGAAAAPTALQAETPSNLAIFSQGYAAQASQYAQQGNFAAIDTGITITGSNAQMNFYEIYSPGTNLNYDFTHTSSGLNLAPPEDELILGIGVAVPAYFCSVGVCNEEYNPIAFTQTLPLDQSVFDIFPATVTEFYNMDWDPRLKPPADQDGDGLIGPRIYGNSNDPDDNNWDSDGDRVSDGREWELLFDNYELTGFNWININTDDADNDGLCDDMELRLGTRVDRADTDGDGLLDGEEVFHQDLCDSNNNGDRTEWLGGWTFTYNDANETTLATSNPLLRDTDFDGYSDGVEKQLHELNPTQFKLHPQAPNQLLGLDFQFYDNEFAAPGERVFLEGAVTNDYNLPVYVAGDLFIDTTPLSGGIIQGDLFLYDGRTIGYSPYFDVPLGLTSQEINIPVWVEAHVFGSQLAPTVNYTTTIADQFPLIIDADDPVVAWDVNTPSHVRAGSTIILGGTAVDPTSYVTSVGIFNLDNVTVAGTEVWAARWQVPATEGRQTGFAFAFDSGNRFSDYVEQIFIVDGTPPTLTGDQANTLTSAQQRNDGRWQMRLTGTTQDPLVDAIYPGSGTNNVELYVEPYNSNWQSATVAAGTNWSIDYILNTYPEDSSQPALLDPSQLYTVTVRGQDAVGNSTLISYTVRIDTQAPEITLDPVGGFLAGTALISTTNTTLYGTATDAGDYASGVAAVSLSFIPYDLQKAFYDALIWLPFNDDEGTSTFSHASFDQTIATSCSAIACPNAGEPGYFGTGILFDGVNDYLYTQQPTPLDATWSFWFQTATDGPLLTTNDLSVYVQGSNVCIDLATQTACSGQVVADDNQWHNLVLRTSNNSFDLYIDGLFETRGYGTLTPTPFTFIGHDDASAYFTGSIDDLTLFPYQLDTALIPDLYNQWQLATLDSPGAISTTWSLTIPNIEGLYEIAVRAEDVAGNRIDDVPADWVQWAGLIDTKPPQTAIDVRYSGVGATLQTHYTMQAADLHLDAETLRFFESDAQAQYGAACEFEPTGFDTLETSWWLDFTGGTNRLYQANATCNRQLIWRDASAILACDLFDNCSVNQPPTDYIYWTAYNGGYLSDPDDTGNRGIWRRPIYSGNAERIIPIAITDAYPHTLLIHPNNQYLFWRVAESASNNIYRSDINGNNVQTVASYATGWNIDDHRYLLGVALDDLRNKLYWGNGRYLYRANLDGSDQEQIHTVPPTAPETAVGVVVGEILVDSDNDRLFWLAHNSAGCPATMGMNELWTASINDIPNTATKLRANYYSGTAQCDYIKYSGLTLDKSQNGSDYALIWRETPYSGGNSINYRADINGAPLQLTNITPFTSDFSFAMVGAVSTRLDTLFSFVIGAVQGGNDVGGLSILRGNTAWEENIQFYSGNTRIHDVALATLTTSDQQETADLQLANLNLINLGAPGITFTQEAVIQADPFIPAINPVYTQTIPSNVTFQSASTDCTIQNNILTCPLGYIGSDETYLLYTTWLWQSGTTYTTTAGVTSPTPDSNPNNNYQTLTTSAQPIPPPPAGKDRYLYWNDDRTYRINLDLGTTAEIPYTNYFYPYGGVAINDRYNFTNAYVGANEPLFGTIAQIVKRFTSGNTITYVEGMNATPRAIHYDPPTDYIYWALQSPNGGIFRTTANSNSPVVHIEVGQSILFNSVVSDPYRGYFYYTSPDGITRAETANPNNKTLIYTHNVAAPDYEEIYDLSFEPYSGYLYISRSDGLYRMLWTGHEPLESVIPRAPGALRGGVVIDPITDQLFWIDDNNVYQANLDGTNVTIRQTTGRNTTSFFAGHTVMGYLTSPSLDTKPTTPTPAEPLSPATCPQLPSADMATPINLNATSTFAYYLNNTHPQSSFDLTTTTTNQYQLFLHTNNYQQNLHLTISDAQQTNILAEHTLLAGQHATIIPLN
ncbi:MAG TPA: LamG-like jellyroll fold domain-containing protein, partial [Anaerolineae bacterium]|nr:LamG-like jellyroll fold domain-containing protein [Anaerolineae bacterium]